MLKLFHCQMFFSAFLIVPLIFDNLSVYIVIASSRIITGSFEIGDAVLGKSALSIPCSLRILAVLSEYTTH